MSDPSWAISSKTEGRIEKGGKANNGRPDHRKESATTFQAWKTLQRGRKLGKLQIEGGRKKVDLRTRDYNLTKPLKTNKQRIQSPLRWKELPTG